MTYTVEKIGQAKRFLDGPEKQRLLRIQAAITILAFNPLPHGSKKLQGLSNTYSIRVGDWRIIYKIDHDSKLICVFRIDDRKNAYKNL